MFNQGVLSGKMTAEASLVGLMSKAKVYYGGEVVVEKKKKREVTLLADAWFEAKDENYDYSQIVDIEGVTETSMVDLQMDGNQLATFNNKVVTLVAENEDGVVTINLVGDKPAHDYVIQATIVEVDV